MPRLACATLAAVLAVPAATAAQERDAADTTAAAPQVADTTWPRLVSLRYAPLAWRDTPLLSAGGRLGLRAPPAVIAARWEARVRSALTADRSERRITQTRALLAVAQADTLPPIPEGRPPGLPPGLEPGTPETAAPLALLSEYADLGLQLRATFALKVNQLRNERCTPADFSNPVSGCQGGFPTPELDQQFNVRAGGVVGDRIHVTVDYDSEREFTANNNINVYYEGLEDEILQRLEVGNVTFNAPASRFITAAVPQNSFGVQARGQLGAFEFNTIVASQRGSQLRERVYTMGETTTQPVQTEIRDLDYESGRIFFVVDPRDLAGFPAIDVLALEAAGVPASVRPTDIRIYRLRAQTGVSNPNLGGITALALRDDGTQVGPFQWHLLLDGRDYYLDPTGLWFVLQSRVSDQDFLAASYITAAGDTVGTFPAVNRGGDTLALIFEPRVGPAAGTFHRELRNAYRIGGQDIHRQTIALAIVVNESERPLDGQGTYLQRFGLARANDASALDQHNRVFPRVFDPDAGAPIRDRFLIFPHLRPFADSTRLQAAERNDSLYRTPTYLLNAQGPPPRFRFRWEYESTGAGDRATLSLGAIAIRDGSERLVLDNQELRRDVHYRIDYSSGIVTFLNPDSLFRGPAEIRAQFEENQSFDQAPKSIIGLSTRYDLGRRGWIDLIGLFQRESSLLTRPQLGFEPQANFIGGISTQLQFRPDGLTSALDALPFISTTTPSTLVINGEVAVSRPNPNQQGQAYLEEFEGAAFRAIALGQAAFQRGSRPVSGRGLPLTHLGATGGFDPIDAVPLVWQNLIQGPDGTLDIFPQLIDSTIVTTGATQVPETILWLTLKPDTVGGMPHPATGRPRWFRGHTPGPRWRSITQPFDRSGLGTDLSRVEFIEVWVLEDADRTARDQGAMLVLDFGTVQEDAVAFGPFQFDIVGADTVFSGFRFLGVGTLDTERDTLTNIFNAARHDVGIHDDFLPNIFDGRTGQPIENFPTCDFVLGGRGIPVLPLGNLLATCTRGNSRADSEDLDGDNRLDVTVGRFDEDVVRYVFPVGDERFFVRTGGALRDSLGRDLRWRLYRVPFREDTIQIGTPNLRQVRALRMTVVAPPREPEREFFVALARLRLVGAPWVKRAATPIAGLTGSLGEPHGEVIASIVSTENQDLGYTSPPGIINQGERQGQAFEVTSVQINEKSLRLLASDLRVDERAEAFVRFVNEADKNFLRYRTLRVWARGRGPGWEDGDLEFFIKAGRDEHNFYMYGTPVRTVTWEPEVVIDLERWLLLRAQIESRWLRGEPPSGAASCGGDPEAYVACDGPYLVHVRDPGLAPPNLAQVSELAVGMRRIRQAIFIDRAELWVDDIRLSDVVDDVGLAGALDVRLQAADVADVTFGYTVRDDRFRQLSEAPSYVTDQGVRLASTFRVDKLFPASWGLNVPIGVQHTRSSADPFYLNRSDVRADALTGLRETRASATTWTFAFRRVRRGTGFLERLFVDPLTVSGLIQQATARTQLSDARTRNRQVRMDYTAQPGPVTTAAAPGFLVGLVNALPGFIRNSEFARALRRSQLRLNPFLIRTSATLTNNRTQRLTYRVPVELPEDSAAPLLRSIVHTLRTDASLDLRPFTSLLFRVDWSATRDLQNYGDSTTLARLLGRGREAFLGRDIGVEQARVLSTSLAVSPVVSSWLRPRVSLGSSFTLTRDPNARSPVRTEGDSAGGFRVPVSFGNTRRREIGATLTPGALIGGVFGDSSLPARLFRRIIPLDGSIALDRRSSFNRAPFAPDLSYQLALGGLDRFRRQEGQPAASAVETETKSLASGVQLPLGIAVRGVYRDLQSVTWTARTGTDEQVQRTQKTTEWPSGTVSWTYTPRWFLRHVLSSISTNLQFREQVSTSVQEPFAEGGEGSRTETRNHTLGPSLSLTWPGGVITSVRYLTAGTDEVTAGNITRSEQKTLSGDVSFGFRPPESLVRLPNEVRTSIAFRNERLTSCFAEPDAEDCIDVSDTRRRAIDLRMDTGFSATVRGGLTFSLLQNEQAHVNTATTQIIFSMFAEVFFVSGQLR